MHASGTPARLLLPHQCTALLLDFLQYRIEAVGDAHQHLAEVKVAAEVLLAQFLYVLEHAHRREVVGGDDLLDLRSSLLQRVNDEVGPRPFPFTHFTVLVLRNLPLGLFGGRLLFV